MKTQEIIEILKLVNKGHDLDSMTILEIRESVIAMTGLVVGLLLTSGKTVEEIKSLVK